MGRGDKKTKKGKIFKGSFGKSRLARPIKAERTGEEKKGIISKIIDAVK
jgi:30S ribosomal protein S31